MFLDTSGIIKARRIYCCSQPANSYLKSEHKVRSRDGLASCYVSTIGKPHEYFDLTAEDELLGDQPSNASDQADSGCLSPLVSMVQSTDSRQCDDFRRSGSTLMGPQARVTNIPSCRERTRSPLPLVIRPDTMVVWTARGQVMSKRMRQPIYGWLVLLVALGTAVVLTAGLLPGPWHSDGQGCTPCKVASQPTLLTAAPVTAEPPTQRASSAPQASEYRELSPASSLSAPRAPPA